MRVPPNARKTGRICRDSRFVDNRGILTPEAGEESGNDYREFD